MEWATRLESLRPVRRVCPLWVFAMTVTLTDFLLARIAEDEAVASYAATRGAPTDTDFGGWWLGHYRHANRWSPARVLAECAAKRRIVKRCADTLAVDGWEYDDAPELAEATLYDLALSYTDHADYRERWKL